jgi:hypothetical protein
MGIEQASQSQVEVFIHRSSSVKPIEGAGKPADQGFENKNGHTPLQTLSESQVEGLPSEHEGDTSTQTSKGSQAEGLTQEHIEDESSQTQSGGETGHDLEGIERHEDNLLARTHHNGGSNKTGNREGRENTVYYRVTFTDEGELSRWKELPLKLQKVIASYRGYTDGRTHSMRDIGREMGVCAQYVSQLYREALGVLAYLNGDLERKIPKKYKQWIQYCQKAQWIPFEEYQRIPCTYKNRTDSKKASH